MSNPVLGQLQRFEEFPSRFVAPRTVDVWLPPQYIPSRPLPVIYMQDGQNLFDPDLAFAGVDWGVDEAVVQLAQDGIIEPAIVVGLWNTDRRSREYMPAKALSGQSESEAADRFVRAHGGGPLSEAYLRFLVEEVVPFVEAEYAVRQGPEGTSLMGSSMGALISAYGVCEYPEVFGGAGCLSTHWPAADGAAVGYLRDALPRPGGHRFYFDYGTQTLDASYEPYQRRVDGLMRERGFQQGRDWITLRFEGAEHSERSWRQRVDAPLRFLLAPSIPSGTAP